MPYDLLAQLRVTVTTAAEAEAVLGAPEETAALPDGGEEWRYFFAPETPPGADGLPSPANAHEQPEVLLLVFGPGGILERQEATRSVFGVRDAAHSAEPDHQAIRDIPLP